jgi:hypothetical protein
MTLQTALIISFAILAVGWLIGMSGHWKPEWTQFLKDIFKGGVVIIILVVIYQFWRAFS